jgi:hypothetical protein
MTTTEHTTSAVTIAEQVVGALAAAWRAIKVRHAEVPEVVLTVGSGTIGPARFGHFAAARWQRGDEALAELFVGGEGLKRAGKYHNKKFQDIAEDGPGDCP